MEPVVKEKTTSDIRALPTLEEYGEMKSNITNYQSQRQLKFKDTPTEQSDNFSRGLLCYEFQVAPNELACIKDSYFKTRVKLTVLDGGNYIQPKATDNVALAENFMNNLLQSCSFSVGNSIICDQNDFCGQISMVNYRLTKTKNWLESLKDVYYLDPSFASRQNQTSSDGALEVTNAGLGGQVTQNPGAAPTDHRIWTVSDGGDWRKGDFISVTGTPPQYSLVIDVTGDDVTIDGLAGDFFRPNTPQNNQRQRHEDEETEIIDGKNDIEIIWQPPLSIFHDAANGLLPQGQYKIKMTNKSDKLSALETTSDSINPTNFSLIVKSQTFVLKTHSSTSNIAMDGVFYLELPTWDIQNRQVNQGRGQTNLTFTLPVTSHLVSFFIQDSGSGSITSVPPSKFVSRDGSQVDMRHYSVNFAGVTKPANMWKSEFSKGVNHQVQRYFETVRNVGLGDTSFESYPHWVERGNLYATSFIKERGDMSTIAQLNMDFGNLEEDLEVFCCAFYRKVCKFTLQNGFITSVIAIET